MIEKEFEWNIDGIQANTVLKGAEISLPIDKSNYKDIFIGNDIKELLNGVDKYIKAIFNSNDKKLNDSLVDEFHLSYLNNRDEYYIIDYYYPEIFNNVLKKLGVETCTLNNISTKEEYDSFINEIKKSLESSKGKSDNADIELLKNSLYKNINDLVDALLIAGRNGIVEHFTIKQIEEEKKLRKNHKPLSNAKEHHISWKNLMLYTACKSLDEFKKTGDIEYYRYAKNYYNCVARNRKCEYPLCMVVNGIYYDYGYTQYNRRFLDVQSNSFPSYLVRLNIEDKDTITRRETLKNGKGLSGMIPSDEPKKQKKLDYSKINSTLARKITFYKGLSGKCQGIINGLKGDTDYIGYVLDNNYVIFDKFYEIPNNGTDPVPAYGNRVYIATLDVLETCDYDRSKLRDYMSKNHDFKAFKYNHTDTDSYQERIKEVLDYHDVSTIKFKELKLKRD